MPIQSNRRFLSRFMGCILCILSFLPACSPAQSELPLDDVTVQLKWVHQAQFAGMYVAQEQGFYQDAGLNVTFLEGGPGINTVDAVTSGRAHFSITSPYEVFEAVNDGQDIKVVASIFQLNPMLFVALSTSGISTPGDFMGRDIAILGTSDYEMQLRAMVDFLDLDINKLNLVPHSYDIEILISEEVDVLGVASIGGLIRLRDRGISINTIWPGNYGVDVSSDSLITTGEMISGHAEIIDRFVKASLQGWHFAVANQDQALDAVMKYAFEADRDVQEKMFLSCIPLIFTGDIQIGTINKNNWVEMHNLMVDQGLIGADILLDDVIYPEFSGFVTELSQ
jgi:NitT/TauT family transport system substrate-binding protein